MACFKKNAGNFYRQIMWISMVLLLLDPVPVQARMYCDRPGPPPEPADLTWLPLKSFCNALQTMPSNPGWKIIEDYPDEDIADCAAIAADLEGQRLIENQELDCTYRVLDIETREVLDYPLICNGNYIRGVWMSGWTEVYDADIERTCPPYPPRIINSSVATKYFIQEPLGPNEVAPDKNLGQPRCGLAAGNPINVATGNKYHREQDSQQTDGLEIVRHYNSQDPAIRSFGVGWRGNLTRHIEFIASETDQRGTLRLVRDDGSVSYWRVQDGQVQPPPDAKGTLQIAWQDGTVLGFTYRNGSGLETYDRRGLLLTFEDDLGERLLLEYADGRLASVTNRRGRKLHYEYGPGGLVNQISASDSASWHYWYDGQSRLVQVEFPDQSMVSYHYEDPDHPTALTGLTDELGNRVRSWAYDGQGRAVSSAHGPDGSSVEHHLIHYQADGSTRVLNPLGAAFNHTFLTVHGVALRGSVDRRCDNCGFARESSYDPFGNPDRVTDFEGHVTDFDYSTANLPERVTFDLGGTAEVTVEYHWDTILRKPVRVERGNRITEYSYNQRGQILGKTEIDVASQASRRWTYEYHEAPSASELIGRLKQVDGPRTDQPDLVSYEYYETDDPAGRFRSGDLKAVVNAAGHRSEILVYDGAGRPLETRDANGIATSVSYHPRGWITRRATAGNVTEYRYDDAGNLVQITGPDGDWRMFEYDTLGRMVAERDNVDNLVRYTLDDRGNRLVEETFDPQGLLVRRLERRFDDQGRLVALIDGSGQETRFSYDANGRRIGELDANHGLTEIELDHAGRPVLIRNAMQGELTAAFDKNGQLTSIMDFGGAQTIFGRDGLGNLVHLSSPDAGDSSHEFDSAGNRLAWTDARGIRADHQYDSLNRLISIDYPGGEPARQYVYDEGEFGKGRLSGMRDASGETTYEYDEMGRIVNEHRFIGNENYQVAYVWNGAGQLLTMRYPSGMTIDYLRDEAGRVVSVEKDSDGERSMLVSEVTYLPHGPVQSFRFGNGLTRSAEFDLDYRVTQLQSGAGLNQWLDLDAAGNVVEISNPDTGESRTYTYDSLDQLLSDSSAVEERGYLYDTNGNRIQASSDAVEESLAYEPGSNRLATQGEWTISRDASGNRLEKRHTSGISVRFEIGEHGRLSRVYFDDGSGERLGAEYVYDAQGQRVAKTVDHDTTHFIYGPGGELLGTYAAGTNGDSVEYVYLDGEPIAVITRETEVEFPPGNEVIVDQGGPGTYSTGSWQSKSAKLAYAGDYLLSRKQDGAAYRWEAEPPGENYEVYAWWSGKKNQSAEASYRIGHGDGDITAVIRSQESGEGWHLLGIFQSGTGPNYVEVSSTGNRLVADALRWVEVPDPIVVVHESVQYVHTDYLGTPRQLSDAGQVVTWRWDSGPFGEGQADPDPDGDGTLQSFALRFPGQYLDAETGLHYNYFRTYDPGLGRYIESDPSGLAGGLNPFAYASNHPLRFVDVQGLQPTGSWMKPPRFNLVSFGIDDVELLKPYLGDWAYYKVFRIHGSAQGFVNIDVRCSEILECGPVEWEVHEKIDISYTGYQDIGPNLAALGAGMIGGSLAGAATGIMTLGGASMTALLNMLKDVRAKGGDKVRWLYRFGPTVFCLATH